MHPVGQLVSVLLLLFKDLLNQTASRVVFISDEGNHLCVGLDSHTFRNEVGPNHGMQIQLLIVVSVTAVNKRGRIEVGLTAQLDNARSYSIGMGLLLVGMYEKFTSYGWRGQAGSGEVVPFVSQNADQFGGQESFSSWMMSSRQGLFLQRQLRHPGCAWLFPELGYQSSVARERFSFVQFGTYVGL